jgi:hypothetical protein
MRSLTSPHRDQSQPQTRGWGDPLDRCMSERLAPPSVTIRRYPASRICDVVVVVRGQEMVVRCPTYFQAVKWARLECKSYKIPEPNTEFPDNQEPGDLPLFLRRDKN